MNSNPKLGKWRPLCYEKQYTDWRAACRECPFRRICESSTEERRMDLKYKYQDYGD